MSQIPIYEAHALYELLAQIDFAYNVRVDLVSDPAPTNVTCDISFKNDSDPTSYNLIGKPSVINNI